MSSVAPSLSSDVSLVSDRILACLKRPGASNDDRLELIEQGLRCVQTGDVFLFIDGVPSLLAQDRGDGEDVTARVKSFYESHPFPSYEGLEGFGELVTKGNRNSFSVDLLNAIGFNKTILECGCGTGQLSQFLQINNNHVLGVDLSLSSLHLAVEHKWRNGLPRSSFAQMDLFDLAIKDDQELIYVYSENDFDPRTPFGTPEEAVTWLKAFAAEQGQRRATIVYSP